MTLEHLQEICFFAKKKLRESELLKEINLELAQSYARKTNNG